ncbi:MAG: putative protease, partial [bacterium]
PISNPPREPNLVPLCRTDAQLEAVIAGGFSEVELDWMELVGLERAVSRARRAGLTVTIATLRVQKPGEEGYDRRIARLEPDGLLVRHWGALEYFRRADAAGGVTRPVLHGDFSLNVSNAATAGFLLERGLADLTPAHDLDRTQLGNLLDRVDPARVTIVLHHHIATFHTEHCVYAHLLSKGKDYRDCGRPCEAHTVALRDRTGDEHPVVVDVGCRNTVFNARAQTAAAHAADLAALGVRRFRVEFVRESEVETASVLSAYRALLAGTEGVAAVVGRVGALERFGVTSGTLRVLA